MTLKTKTLLATGAAALSMVLPALGPADALGARVTVPVDRANPSAGRLSLYVERVRATGTKRHTLLYVAGGPGSAATAEAEDVAATLGRDVRRTTELIAFDARGTGKSELFECPALQRDRTLRSTSAAAACAEKLGPKRGISGVDEQVEDIEAVRQALGVRSWSLLGVSYGTEVAQRYAQRYPARVKRMVLDSVLPPEGPSALSLEVFAGMERVLRALCARKKCPASMADPARELPALIAQLRAAPLTGPVFSGPAKARNLELNPVEVLDTLLAGDFSPALRLALPAAIASARQGDAVPLLRLKALDQRASPQPQADAFSVGQYAATSCESLELPWDGAADPATRRAQAAERIAALGPAPFAPFDGQTVLDGDFLPLCLGWPAPTRAHVAPPREVPRIPALLIAGEEDLRTPLESAIDAASRNPAARVLRVGGVGHSVLTSDDTGCAARAARRFLLAGTRPPARCSGPRPYLDPIPIPPAGLDDLGPGRTKAQFRQRTLRAIDLTLDDVVLAISVGGARGGGLRGGGYRVVERGIELDEYAYTPIQIDMTPLRNGAARIKVLPGVNIASGTIVLQRSGRFTGRLDGRRVRGSFDAGPPAL